METATQQRKLLDLVTNHGLVTYCPTTDQKSESEVESKREGENRGSKEERKMVAGSE